MKYFCHLAGVLAVGLFCTGCWPERVTTSPASCGVVVDAQTHVPVSGAKVQMSYTWRAYWTVLNPPELDDVITNTRPLGAVYTGASGEFSIPREHVWAVMYPEPVWETWGTLIVQCDGYEPALIPVSDRKGLDEKERTVMLKPVASEAK